MNSTIDNSLRRLRSGTVLIAPDAAVGEPMLHRSVGNRYTGALPVASDGRRIHTTDSDQALVAVDPVTGEMEERWTPHENAIIWQIMCERASDSIIARTDSAVHLIGTDAPQQRYAGSWLRDAASAEGLLMIASHSDRTVTVERIVGGAVLMSVAVSPELYAGHTPLLHASLSGNGSTVAWCDTQSFVQVQRIGETTVRAVPIPGGLVERIVLSRDGAIVFVAINVDAATRIVARDTRTGDTVAGWPDIAGTRLDLAIGDGRVAVLADAVVTLHDESGGQPELTFGLQHVARWAGIAWHGRDLAVRTDSGCLSLYRCR